MTDVLVHGDFTDLAESYSRYREGYALPVRDAIFGLCAAPPETLDVADVGAGTGIWSRLLAERAPRSLTAVEPNDSMRAHGIADSRNLPIAWRAGSGEATGLEAGSADLLTMASSFHWVGFDAGLREFHRVLRPGGWFVALWNPRDVSANPLLHDIEQEITRLKPDLRRVSSGRSDFTASLSGRLASATGFGELVYLEGRHVVRQSVARYLGLWESANDVPAQLGEELFARFLGYAKDRLAEHETVETTYLTRAWAVRRE
ncbi:class I SAM-dependent methyltransferase [Amycolatopsis acidiphila]|uniref:Class I SAM-dependent methyltransferase n=1 Tax=Amycolatopsis acidiphila TaxID=715473 RepID=A0A557ZPV9_9PSEU|nr:class I SAM-dependent methyltransferase [Amycolatopsis acidiphila]TVT14054.1 class I SAM-dependent methyltransferase [Amycolatopsis acidiphila]UIJ63602.1 class I SAM-dependent methyltransferase [Amycolatopsis acidiphila]GHG67994.1 methyltransferase [Amycolatopsis acidiphila]